MKENVKDMLYSMFKETRNSNHLSFVLNETKISETCNSFFSLRKFNKIFHRVLVTCKITLL